MERKEKVIERKDYCSVLRVQGYFREKRSGEDNAEEPPVPIPNTEVKLRCADDIWRVTARESRYSPDTSFLISI